MFLRKLAVSLCVLLSIILLQAGMAFWAQQNSEFHTERNRVANQMLAEFISLRADKQRLKVWLAEYLLTEDANTQFRDTLFARMQQQLTTLEQLAIRDQLYHTTETDLQHTMQQVKVISLLQTNLQTLEQALKTREIARYKDDAERWTALISLFDKIQDTDLAELLQQAIVGQRQRAQSTESDALNAVQSVKRTTILISLLGLVLAIMLGFYLARALSRPLQSLLDGTKQLQQGHFEYRIAEQGPGEFAELARQFNLMSGYIAEYAKREKQSQLAAEQLVAERTSQLQQALDQLHQAEYRQKQLLADISHELRTPATSIQGEAEISLRGQPKSTSDYQDAFSRILSASQQLSRRIDDLLLLARGEDRLRQVQLHTKPLSQFIQQSISTIQQWLPAAVPLHTAIAGRTADPLYLLVDDEKFSAVLRIIVDNARQYAKDSPALNLKLYATETELQLTLADQGIGIQPDEIAQVFARHYRSSAARQARPDGLGIGLCIAKDIMEAHDGAISLTANQPRGTCVTLTLPLFPGVNDEDSDR